MLFRVQSGFSLLTCFQGWPLTANQEVRQSFHVGGCKISAAKDSNNAVARSRYIGEIKKQMYRAVFWTLWVRERVG